MKRIAAAAACAWLLIGALGCDDSSQSSTGGASGSGAAAAPSGRSGRAASAAASSPAARSLIGGAGQAPATGPLAGRGLFDGDTRGGSVFGFGGDAVPVSRPSAYSGPFSSVSRVSDLNNPVPAPAVLGDSQKESRLMQFVHAAGGDVRVAAEVLKAAARKGIDPILALAVTKQENQLRVGSVSGAGALGPMQLMPDTACELAGCRRVDAAFKNKVHYDVAFNADLGTTYLRQMLSRQGGNVPLALASYNAGPGAVNGRIPNNGETPDYVNKVLGYYRSFRDAVSM